MATATKSNIALRSLQGAIFAVERFLASMGWNGCGNYRRECVSHTGQNSLLPMRLFIQNPSFRTSFRSLTTCRADTYVSLGGSNGCADQLTNWDGHTEVWIRNTTKKDVTRFIQIMTMRGDLWRWLLHIASNYRNAMPKIKISNYLFFRLNKISYFCCQ